MKCKRAWSILLAAVFLCALGGVVWCCLMRPVNVNNEDMLIEIATEEYSLEKLMLVEAVFKVRDGFRDVYASELADEVDVRLECKRQTAPDAFYYVLYGGGQRRCFIFVNEMDVVEQVLLIREFTTIEDTKTCAENCRKYQISLTETIEHNFRWQYLVCGREQGYWYTQFVLQDGVLLLKEPSSLLSDAAPEYFYYTDVEWATAYKEWNGFVVLPIDKADNTGNDTHEIN